MRDDRAHPREAVEHHRDERPVAPARERARVDRREEPARLGRREHRRRALRDDVLRPPDGRRRVHRDNLADDEPVAEHADRRQVLLDGGRRPGVGPDVGRHVQRRDRREPQAPRLAPRQELPHGSPVRRPRPRGWRSARRKTRESFSTAAGPASTISRGQHELGPLRELRARDVRQLDPHDVFVHSRTSPIRRLPGLPCSTNSSKLLVVVRQRLGEREEAPDGVLRPTEAYLDPVPGSTDTPAGRLGQASPRAPRPAPPPGSR